MNAKFNSAVVVAITSVRDNARPANADVVDVVRWVVVERQNARLVSVLRDFRQVRITGSTCL